jgi:hypothetical protein
VGTWLAANWFDLLSAVGIVGSLLFTTVSLQSEAKTRRIANLLILTQNHREIWSEMIRHANLARVLDVSANLQKESVSVSERLFINMVIQHLNSAFEAIKTGLAIKPEGLRQDVRWFFSLPIPRAIWDHVKRLQNDDFVAFVQHCRQLPEAGNESEKSTVS